jgi:glutathione S-transferase
MITLYGFGPVWGLRDLSPFVGKVDTYFRLAGIPYRLERFPFFGIGGAPKGKLPFIEHNGRRIADSSFILAHVQNTFGKGPDAALDDAQRARGHAIRRLVEEHLYWVLVQNRLGPMPEVPKVGKTAVRRKRVLSDVRSDTHQIELPFRHHVRPRQQTPLGGVAVGAATLEPFLAAPRAVRETEPRQDGVR